MTPVIKIFAIGRGLYSACHAKILLMTPALVLFLLLIGPQKPPQNPKNDPNGIWESMAGTKFALKLSGMDLRVQLAEESNSRYLKYEVELKNVDDPNIYKGRGYFVAKMETGKECRFDTDWDIVVVAPNHIVGSTTLIVPDPNTCEAKESGRAQIELKKGS
jgi:hypothetical protein